MKKIFFLVRSLNVKSGGGSHFNAIEQITALKRIGYSVSVHTFTNNNNYPKELEVIQHDLKDGFISEQLSLCELMKEFEEECDLFFLYGVDFMWGAGRYKKEGGVNKVCVYLDTYLPSMFILSEHQLVHRIKRFLWDHLIGLRLARKVDIFFSVSPWLQMRYEAFGLPHSKFKLLPNYLDLKSDVLPNHKRNCKNNVPQLLYAGRITKDKGIDLLIESLSKIEDIDWDLTIVGDGESKSAVQTQVTALGLSSRVNFVPWVSQERLRDMYHEADVFVHPARWPEPFGRTVVEALYNGLPVIVPKEGGSSWIAGEAGYQFSNGNLNSLISVLREALEDVLSGNLSKSNKAKNRASNFALESNISKLQSLFNTIT